jgi:methane/ammonia monooxygenase subunit A
MAFALEAPRIGRAKFSRKWDLLLILGVIFIVPAAYHVSNMLTVGDWDFWSDWKDRQWWATLTPALSAIVPGALHYIGWSQLRIPIGATLGTVLLLLAQLLNRRINFGMWDGYPFNFVWPATMIMAAVIWDCVLMWTRGSYVITSVVGGFIFGLLFVPQQFMMLAPFHQPVVYNGTLLSLADVQGFMYLRTATHEYLRIIEQGTLRAFLEEITITVAFFSGLITIGFYWFGMAIGKFLAVVPARTYFKRRPAAKPFDDEFALPASVVAGRELEGQLS